MHSTSFSNIYAAASSSIKFFGQQNLIILLLCSLSTDEGGEIEYVKLFRFKKEGKSNMNVGTSHAARSMIKQIDIKDRGEK